MADNVIESYLVKLGSTVDVGSFNKFNATLKAAETSVVGMAGSTVGSFMKMEAAIVSTFTAVGLGIIKLADKTAMADQQYRLFGLRMLMGKDQARAMQMALDTLGATMDEVAYDPELNKRFQDLYKRNLEMGKSLGPMFDKNMIGIRGLRTEFKQFGNELTFLSMGTISKLYDKLGFGSGDLLKDVRNLNDEFMKDLPKWSDQAATFLVPIWGDFKAIVKDVAGLFKMAAGDFTYLTGVMTGDTSLQTTTFSIQNIAKATLEWADGLTKVSLTLGLMARIGNHAFLAIADSAAAAYHATMLMYTRDPKHLEAAKDLMNKAADESVGVAADVRDIGNPGNWKNNADFSGIVAYNTAHGFDPVTGKTTAPATADGSQIGGRVGNLMSTLRSESSSDPMKALAASVSEKTGIPAALIYAQWAHETNGFTSSVFKTKMNAAGIEHSDKTYKSYGSLKAFGDDYARIIMSKRYTSKGIRNVHSTDEMAAALKAGSWYEDTEQHYAGGMRRFSGLYDSGRGSGVVDGGTQVNVGTVNVYPPPGTTHEQAKNIVDKIAETGRTNSARMTATTGSGYSSTLMPKTAPATAQ